MCTNIKTEFVITGENFDLDRITQELEIQPTEQWIKGEQIPNRNKKIVRVDTCWSYSLGEEVSLDMNNQLIKLLELLSPKKNKLLELKKMFNIEFLILVIINVENDNKPTISIKTPAVEFLHYINAELDVALYIF